MAPISKDGNDISLEEAALFLGQSRECLLQWIYRAKRATTKNARSGDAAFKGLPYHQVCKGSPYKFRKERLEFWWNNKYNIGTVNA